MSENILSAVLTFSLLAGGTAAIGSEMFGTRASAPLQVVTLPRIEVTGQRDTATLVAFERRASEPRRAQ